MKPGNRPRAPMGGPARCQLLQARGALAARRSRKIGEGHGSPQPRGVAPFS